MGWGKWIYLVSLAVSTHCGGQHGNYHSLPFSSGTAGEWLGSYFDLPSRHGCLFCFGSIWVPFFPIPCYLMIWDAFRCKALGGCRMQGGIWYCQAWSSGLQPPRYLPCIWLNGFPGYELAARRGIEKKRNGNTALPKRGVIQLPAPPPQPLHRPGQACPQHHHQINKFPPSLNYSCPNYFSRARMKIIMIRIKNWLEKTVKNHTPPDSTFLSRKMEGAKIHIITSSYLKN